MTDLARQSGTSADQFDLDAVVADTPVLGAVTDAAIYGPDDVRIAARNRIAETTVRFAESALRDRVLGRASTDWTARLTTISDDARAQACLPPDRANSADAAAAAAIARLGLYTAALAAIDVGARTPSPAPWRSTLSSGLIEIGKLVAGARAEVAHVFGDRPHSVLMRVVITLAISLSLVVVYRVADWGHGYRDADRLALYVIGTVIGSAVCTNALSFDARRALPDLASGRRLWQILCAKNIAHGLLVGSAGVVCSVVIAYFGWGSKEFVSLLLQMLTMIIVWLGIGNLLSVLAPLRIEPMSARLADGTWVNYLVSFGISYVVGLGANLVIYWKLWSAASARHELGSSVLAVALVVVSALFTWFVFTVIGVSAANRPAVRRALVGEMIVYRAAHTPAGGSAE